MSTVRMVAPNGQVKEVPADQVAHFQSLGAVVESSTQVEPVDGYDADRDMGRAAKILKLSRRLAQMNRKLSVGVSNPKDAARSKLEADRDRVQAELESLADPNTAFGGLGPARAKALMDLIPTIGGMGLGFMAGGPAGASFGGPAGVMVPAAIRAILGATAGGSGGEAVRQLIARRLGFDAPETPGEAIAGIAEKGGEQGLQETLGQGASLAFKGAAKALAGDALRVPASVEKARTNPRIPESERIASAADLMLRERVAPGKGLTERLRGLSGGADRAHEMLDASLADLDKEVAKMGRAKMPRVTVNEVVSKASPGLSKIKSKATEIADIEAVDDYVRRQVEIGHRYSEKTGRRLRDARMTPGELLTRKRSWEKVAGPLYDKESRTGMAPRVRTTSEIEMDTARKLADAARNMLREGSDQFGTGSFDAINRRTREMAALQQALHAVESRPTSLLPSINPNAATTNWALTHPWLTSRTALLLNHPSFRPMLPAAMRVPDFMQSYQEFLEP